MRLCLFTYSFQISWPVQFVVLWESVQHPSACYIPILFFVLFAVGILLSSAAANAMATSTAANSVMCSGPIVPSSSEPSSSSTVALCSCLRKSTDARTASANRITFAGTVVFKSKNGKVRRLCPRKVDKSVKRSRVKPLVLRQDCNCSAIYCETCSSCV